MSHFTTVPVFLGKGLNVWLGIPLFFLLMFQLATGFLVNKGNYKLFKFHKINAVALLIIVLIHAYYGFGIWFLGFKQGP